MKDKPHKAVIYCRVSTQAQETGTSLAGQFVSCTRKAQELGIPVALHLEDTQSGADYLDRSGLQKALSLIEKGEADTLIIYDMSRYSRDSEHQQAIRKRVQLAGGRLLFATQTFDESPEGELMFDVTGGFVAYERKKIRQRTVEGKRNRARQNVQPCRSFVPYGYHIVTKEDAIAGLYDKEQVGHYVIIEDRAVWVREIFQRYAHGASLRAVARYLTEAGAPTSRGGRHWAVDTVREMLKNEVYKGQAGYGKTQRIVDESRVARGLSKVTHRAAPPDSAIPISAPAIVDEALWQAAQERIEANKQMLSGRPDSRWLLSGLLKCPTCGRGMGGYKTGGYRRRKDGTWPEWKEARRYYKCRSSARAVYKEQKTCPLAGIPAARLDQTVLDKVLEYADDPDVLVRHWQAQETKARQGAKGQNKVSAKKLEARLASLRRREELIINAQLRALESGASSEVYEEKLKELCRERDGLTEKLTAAQKEEEQAETAPQVFQEQAQLIAKKIKDVRRALTAPDDKVPPHEKRELLATFIERIIPLDREGKKVEIVFKSGGGEMKRAQ